MFHWEVNYSEVAEVDIRYLRSTDLQSMFTGFKEAFSDYPAPFDMDMDSFVKKFVDKLKINFELSGGAFSGDDLVGFIFTSVNEYEGLLTAYNGGTGVIPDFRGRQLTKKIYDFLIPIFQVRDIRQCVLEVLTDNEVAIRVYSDIGFVRTKLFRCFRLHPVKYSTPKINYGISILQVDEPDWKTYTKFFSYTPSYLDTISMINSNLKNEKVIEVRLGEETVGYAIYQPPLGRISHIAVAPNHRGKGIGTHLIHSIYEDSRNKYLTLINMIDSARETRVFFEKLGFENNLNQHEMILKI